MKTFSRSLFLFPLTILALAVSTAGCGHSSNDSSRAEKNRSAELYTAMDACNSMIGTTESGMAFLTDASGDCKPGPDGQALGERAPQITSVMLGDDPQRELKITWTFDAPSQVEFLVLREISPTTFTEITDAYDRPSVLDTSNCWTLSSGIKQCSYTETNLLPISASEPSDVTYTYIVMAKNIDPLGSDEMSSFEEAVAGKKSKRTAPPLGDPANIEDFRPQNLEGLRSADRTQITLSWDAPSNTADLETYIIERRHIQDGIRYFDLAEQTSRELVNTGLLANHHYSYRVFAKYPEGVSAAAAVGEFTNEPIPPTNVGAQWITETQINVSWAHSGENATGFIVERSLNSTSGFLPIPCAEGSDGNTRGCQDVNSPGNQLIPDTTYYYCVRTVNGSMTSECSGSVPAEEESEPLSSLISAGSSSSTCAIRPDNGIMCWGQGEYGHMGNGSTDDAWGPGPVFGISNATQVNLGTLHACALLPNQTIKCWGQNSHGQLGDLTTTDSLIPVAVQNISDAVSMHLGGQHTCAALSNGIVKCWGYGAIGQLGNGSDNDSLTPVTVSGITDALSLGGGFSHTCALLSSGSIKCWGKNQSGELGNGSTSSYINIPLDVVGISNALTVRGGFHHTCAVLATGEIKCWGSGDTGTLGNGANENSASPVFVTGISNAVKVNPGLRHTCAVLADGSVACWGDNQFGVLGDGTNNDSNVPVSTLISDVVEVTGGLWHSCAILSDGSAKCWGFNVFGNLGIGHIFIPWSHVPVEVRFDLASPPAPDADGDGWPVPLDCDDTNPDRHPGAADTAGNNVDLDCKPDVVSCERNLPTCSSGYNARVTLNESTYEPYETVGWGYLLFDECHGTISGLTGSYACPTWSSKGYYVEKHANGVRFTLHVRSYNMAGQQLNASCWVGD